MKVKRRAIIRATKVTVDVTAWMEENTKDQNLNTKGGR